jgi:hypothetical protein
VPGPIVDPDDVRGGSLGHRQAAHAPQYSIGLTGKPWRAQCRAPAAPPNASPV